MQAAQLFRRSGGPDIVFPDDRVRIAVIVGARHDVISVVGCDDDDNDLERAGEAPGVALRGFERHGLSPVRSGASPRSTGADAPGRAAAVTAPAAKPAKIGRASCRARVCQYV